MNFIDSILQRLRQTPETPVLQEVRDGRLVAVTCGELLLFVRAARAFLRKAGVAKGDRCAVVAHNSVRWAALDLACMSEGIIMVPLYARQAPVELVGMLKDSTASLVCCGDPSLYEAVRDPLTKDLQRPPSVCLFDDIFNSNEEGAGLGDTHGALADEDPVTIIYTSGTSGEPKGVVLNVGNLNHMLGCVNARLDLLMGPRHEPDQVFHYLPFCFAGSRILLLTCLSRNSVLTMSADLTKLVDEMKVASPDYFINVPALLERVRSGVEESLSETGGVGLALFNRGKAAWFRRQGRSNSGPRQDYSISDSLSLALAKVVVFRKIRKKLGPKLKALICGSAPLAKDTQLFFMMIGLPVLQVYGLTETTAICTMDHPRRVTPGRVGPAISGIQMKLGEGDEILVRGPNIFPGYWNRPQETANAFTDGWFRTGDQGEVDEEGNWNIIGRLKNLIILSSGHNIAPEPIEDMALKALPGAQQVLLAGNGHSFLSAIITGDISPARAEGALAVVNSQLPHYKCIRAFHIHKDPFSIEDGMLTPNGKLKREVILGHFRSQIEDLYQTRKA